MYITEVPQKERANIDIVSVALNYPQKPDHLTSQKLIYTRTRDRVCYLKTEMKLKTKLPNIIIFLIMMGKKCFGLCKNI